MPAFDLEQDYSASYVPLRHGPGYVAKGTFFHNGKACLKTIEGVRWTMTKEERPAKDKRSKPTISDPTGLFRRPRCGFRRRTVTASGCNSPWPLTQKSVKLSSYLAGKSRVLGQVNRNDSP